MLAMEDVTMKRWLCLIGLGLGLCSAAVGCKDAVEDVDEKFDCSAICNKYKECFDKDYDVDKCRDHCEARADDPDSNDQEQTCSDCIGDMSCGGATFRCADDCIGIVP
jgi:hypothetical protein